MFKFFVSSILLFSSVQVLAWGGRGHHTICSAAVHLVKSPELRAFLKIRPHTMGHLCNVPDIYWKSLSSEVRKSGDPTHYFNVEKLGLKLNEVPADYKKIITDFTGKPSRENNSKTLFSVPDEIGSSWWRADQFYRLAVEAAAQAKSAVPPKDFKEEQNNDMPYNKAVYNMVLYMGLMGHYIGDNSQPFHVTSDHDGYAAGHGGIHAYYEEAVISAQGGDLEARVIKAAEGMKSQKFTSQTSVVEAMRSLSESSYTDVKEVLKADKVIKASTLVIDKGMSLKTAAERKPATETLKNFDKISVKHLARASLLLAHLWDEAYKAAQQPELKPYRSYLYPFTPDFVKPDYIQ